MCAWIAFFVCIMRQRKSLPDSFFIILSKTGEKSSKIWLPESKDEIFIDNEWFIPVLAEIKWSKFLQKIIKNNLLIFLKPMNKKQRWCIHSTLWYFIQVYPDLCFVYLFKIIKLRMVLSKALSLLHLLCTVMMQPSNFEKEFLFNQIVYGNFIKSGSIEKWKPLKNGYHEFFYHQYRKF